MRIVQLITLFEESLYGATRLYADLAAAGDVEDRACNEAGFGGEQEENGRCDFFGLSAALHGDEGFYAIDAGGLAAFGVDRRVDEAGAHGVDADAFFGDFFGEPDGEGFDGGFGCGVIDALAGGTRAGLSELPEVLE